MAVLEEAVVGTVICLQEQEDAYQTVKWQIPMEAPVLEFISWQYILIISDTEWVRRFFSMPKIWQADKIAGRYAWTPIRITFLQPDFLKNVVSIFVEWWIWGWKKFMD